MGGSVSGNLQAESRSCDTNQKRPPHSYMKLPPAATRTPSATVTVQARQVVIQWYNKYKRHVPHAIHLLARRLFRQLVNHCTASVAWRVVVTTGEGLCRNRRVCVCVLALLRRLQRMRAQTQRSPTSVMEEKDLSPGSDDYCIQTPSSSPSVAAPHIRLRSTKGDPEDSKRTDPSHLDHLFRPRLALSHVYTCLTTADLSQDQLRHLLPLHLKDTNRCSLRFGAIVSLRFMKIACCMLLPEPLTYYLG